MNQLLNVIDIIDWQKHGFEQDLTSLNASTIFSFQSAIKKDYIKNIHTNQFLPLQNPRSQCWHTDSTFPSLPQVDWPDAIMDWPECSPESDEKGNLIWRGLRIQMGMAYGLDAAKRPLNTGML